MIKKRLFIIAGIIMAIVAFILILAPLKFAERYEVNIRSHIATYLENKKARQPQIEAILQKGTATSADEDKKLHELIGAERLAASPYPLPAPSFFSWHPAYQKPMRIQRELEAIAANTKQAYQISDIINAYLEKRIPINARITNNPLETAEHRQQMINDYKDLVATNSENDLLQRDLTKEAIANKLAVDERYLELWSQYPAMYERSDNTAIDTLNNQILANDQQKDKANKLIDQMVKKTNQDIQANHEKIKKLRDSI